MKFKLSKQQQKHLDSIVKSTEKRMREKYIHGAEEHKGDLWNKDCLSEAFDEAIDLMVYLQTEILKKSKKTKRKLKKNIKELKKNVGELIFHA